MRRGRAKAASREPRVDFLPDGELDRLLAAALETPPADHLLTRRVEDALMALQPRRSAPRLGAWLWLVPLGLSCLAAVALWLLGEIGLPLSSVAGALFGAYMALASLPEQFGSGLILLCAVPIALLNLAFLTGLRPGVKL